MKANKKPRTARTTLNKRTPAQRAQDPADIARLVHEGKAHREIADWIWLNHPYKLAIALGARMEGAVPSHTRHNQCGTNYW